MSVWEALTKKIPATSAGTKFQNKEKPAACELLTAGVGCDVNNGYRWPHFYIISYFDTDRPISLRVTRIN